MSLIGIDLGSSAIKVGAYAVDGTSLASAHRSVPTYRPEPGHSEVDVLESRAAFRSALAEVSADRSLAADPPVAISFSSSGREVFPVAADGTPLGRCLMTSDTRGDEVAAATAARRSPEEWQRLAGHVPRRMDPVNRALWWRATDPATAARTRWFMNWHEFYALLLSGRPVVDWSDAGTWATYDVATGAWSAERIQETGIDPAWLPEIQPNGSPIGPILPAIAAEIGLPVDTLIVTGAFDTYAAAVGSAAVDPGVVSLACGTWNSFNMPVTPGWPVELVHDGIGVYPHPGPTGFGILVTDPNGMAVVDWARSLLHLSIPDLEAGLAATGPGPGHVFADAAFTPLPHVAATPGFGGTFSGVTLAATAGRHRPRAARGDRLPLLAQHRAPARARHRGAADPGDGRRLEERLVDAADRRPDRCPGRGRRPGRAGSVRRRHPGRCRRRCPTDRCRRPWSSSSPSPAASSRILCEVRCTPASALDRVPGDGAEGDEDDRPRPPAGVIDRPVHAWVGRGSGRVRGECRGDS